MGKRGPKPSGVQSVVYYRRVDPVMVPRLDSFLRGAKVHDDGVARTLEQAVDAATDKATKAGLDKAMVGWEPVKPDETVELKAQIRALLETIGEMEDSIECLRAEIHALEELDLDEKGKLGWRKYYAIKEGKGEFDQE